MGMRICGTGSFVPARRVTNDELAETIDTSHEWIVTATGIESRHLLADGESTVDMAARAATDALESAGVEAEDLGMVIVGTSTQDYQGMPSTACILQDRLGAVNAGAFDLAAACSGFVYGIECGRALGAGRDRPILVVGADAMSRIVDWQDRNTCVLFGDGAGAVVLSPSAGDAGVLDSYLRADGSGHLALTVEGGARKPKVQWKGEDCVLRMNGRAVFNFAVRALVEVVNVLLERNDVALSDVSYVVPHQGNIRIIQAASKRLDLPVSHFFTNIREVANTSAASIPIALHEMAGKGMLSPGDTILTVGFGAGLTYGGNLIRWG